MVSFVKGPSAPATFCLPKKYTQPFLTALGSGALDINALSNMDSAGRRGEFAKIVGDENAREVNAEFESKLLLKNRQKGMRDWIRSVSGIPDPVKKTIEDQIMSMDRILNPASQKAFLADLARKKLGAVVTDQESKAIFQQAQKAAQLKTVMLGNDTKANRIAWGRAQLNLDDLVESMKPDGQTWVQKVLNIADIPRSLQTGVGHMSAFGVQLLGTISTKEFWKGIPEMVRYLAKEENYQNSRAYMISHPNYQRIKSSGLIMGDLSNVLSRRDEELPTAYTEQFNQWVKDQTNGIVPNIFRASGRGFVGAQNIVKFELMNRFIEALKASGGDIRPGSQDLKDIAEGINHFTGKAALGKNDRFRNITPVTNGIFYALRKTVGNFQVLNPWEYVKPQSPVARRMKFRLLIGSSLALGGLLGLFAACGYKVDTNPISEDFLKPVSPDGTKFELLDGFPSIIRLAARIMTGRTISGQGVESEFAPSWIPGLENKDVGHKVQYTPDGRTLDLGNSYPTTRGDLILQFWRGKLAPLSSWLTDIVVGQDPVGREPTFAHETKEHLSPIFMKQIQDFMTQNPEDSAAYIPALSTILGIGMQSPIPPQSKMGLTVWGDPDIGWIDPARSEIDKRLQGIGYRPSFPGPTLNGVHLTDEQYREYIFVSGRWAKQRLSNYFSHPEVENIPKAIQMSTVKGIIATGRSIAGAKILAESVHGEDNIFKKMNDNWRARNGIPLEENSQNTNAMQTEPPQEQQEAR